VLSGFDSAARMSTNRVATEGTRSDEQEYQWVQAQMILEQDQNNAQMAEDAFHDCFEVDEVFQESLDRIYMFF
jgi:hypothetical protein